MVLPYATFGALTSTLPVCLLNERCGLPTYVGFTCKGLLVDITARAPTQSEMNRNPPDPSGSPSVWHFCCIMVILERRSLPLTPQGREPRTHYGEGGGGHPLRVRSRSCDYFAQLVIHANPNQKNGKNGSQGFSAECREGGGTRLKGVWVTQPTRPDAQRTRYQYCFRIFVIFVYAFVFDLAIVLRN